MRYMLSLIKQKLIQLYKLSLACYYIQFPINSKMGGCAGLVKNLQEKLPVSNALKYALKAPEIADTTNLASNLTNIMVDKINGINNAIVPAPEYRFNKDIAEIILQAEDIVPNLQKSQVQIPKKEMKPNIEVTKQEGKVYVEPNQLSEVIEKSSKIKANAHKDGTEQPQTFSPQNRDAAKSHLSQHQLQDQKATSQLSLQKQPKLQELADSLPISKKQAIMVSSIQDMSSIHEATNPQLERSKIPMKAHTAIQETIKLSAVQEESEIVNDQNTTNFALPINFKLALTVQWLQRL